MDLPKVKRSLSGGKLVPRSGLRVGTALGDSWRKLKYRDLNIGTWNVRSLNTAGGLKSVANEVNGYNLDVVALQEVRWPGEGSMRGGKYTIWYAGSGNHCLGTGFLIRNRLLSALRDV